MIIKAHPCNHLLVAVLLFHQVYNTDAHDQSSSVPALLLKPIL